MSIFLILTGKSELILETERRKDVKRAKIIKINIFVMPQKDAGKTGVISKSTTTSWRQNGGYANCKSNSDLFL